MRTQIIRGRRIESCLDSSVRCGSHFPTVVIPVLCGLPSPHRMNISAGLPPRFLFRGHPIYVLYKYQGSLFYTPLLSSCVQLASNWVGQPLATQSRPVSRAKKATTTTTKSESYFLYSFPALASSLCSSQEANTICRQTRGNGGGTGHLRRKGFTLDAKLLPGLELQARHIAVFDGV